MCIIFLLVDGVSHCAKLFSVKLGGEYLVSQNIWRATVLERQAPSPTSSTTSQPLSGLLRPGGAVCRIEAAGYVGGEVVDRRGGWISEAHVLWLR